MKGLQATSLSEPSSNATQCTPNLIGTNVKGEEYGLKIPKRIKPRCEANSSAKNEFFGNLDNYMPVGSMTVERDESLGHEFSDNWDELRQPLNLDRNTLPIFGLLDVLLCHDIVRVFIRRHQRLDQKVTLRVYMLPDDVGRRFVDRGNYVSRGCFKKLMLLLNPSFESWEGRNDSTRPLQEEVEDQPYLESLFYLFNTLPSPSPRIELVSCPTAKGAMSSLLDLKIMPGLKNALYPYQKRSAAEMIRRETAPLLKLDPRFQAMEGPTGRHFYYDSETGILLHDREEYEEVRGGILAEVGNNEEAETTIMLIRAPDNGLG